MFYCCIFYCSKGSAGTNTLPRSAPFSFGTASLASIQNTSCEFTTAFPRLSSFAYVPSVPSPSLLLCPQAQLLKYEVLFFKIILQEPEKLFPHAYQGFLASSLHFPYKPHNFRHFQSKKSCCVQGSFQQSNGLLYSHSLAVFQL